MHANGSRALRTYAVVVGLAITAHVVAPNASAASAADLAVSAIAAGGCWVGLRLHRPDRPGPWRWLLISLVAALLGSGLWIVLEVAGRNPTAARAFYLVAYACAAVGVWRLVSERSGHDGIDRVLSSAIVTAAAAIVTWLFVVQPLGRATDLGDPGQLMRLLFPTFSFGLAVLLVRFLAGRTGPGVRAYWLVTGGLASFFLADVGEVVGLGGTGAGGVTATVRLVAYGLIGMATLDPSVGETHDTDGSGSKYRLSRPELLVALFAGIAGPMSLVVRLDAATRVELVVIGLGSALLVALVVARLWRLLGALTASARRENEDRFRALVENAGDVICVVAPSGRVLYVSPTVERVWGYPPEEMVASGFGMIARADRRRLAQLLRELVSGAPGGVARAEGSARHADGSWRRFEAVFANRVDDPAIRGVVITSHDVTERVDLEQRLWNQAFVDQLTGLPNRALLLERAGSALRGNGEGGRPALLVIDIDDFKTVNDSLGPRWGDELLRTLGRRLASIGGDEATAARLAGDEFGLLLASGGSAEEIETFTTETIEVVCRPVTLGGRRIEPRVSVGVAVGTPGGAPNDLLRDADAAMHVAKGDAGSRFHMFDPGMHAEAVRRLQLQMDLGTAIEREQLWVAYQPIYEIRTGSLAAVEALLRWEHPVRGAVSPAEFIPLAEGSGRIGALGEFVLRRACEDLARHRATTGTDVSLSVNLSPAQLGDPLLGGMVASALADSALPPDRLTLEVTEGVFLGDGRGVLDALHGLRQLGVRLAIDDFGTGYCALGYLTRFRFDVVKIDRSFIEVLDVPGADRRVTTGILELVASLEVPAVAEGIETLAQLEALRAAGCEYGQGFHWSRPVPIHELTQVPGGDALSPTGDPATAENALGRPRSVPGQPG